MLHLFGKHLFNEKELVAQGIQKFQGRLKIEAIVRIHHQLDILAGQAAYRLDHLDVTPNAGFRLHPLEAPAHLDFKSPMPFLKTLFDLFQ